MTAMESDQDNPSTPNHSWWKRVLFGALIGAVYGALNIWFYEVSLVRLIAAIISGATFFAVLGLLAPKFGKDRNLLRSRGFPDSWRESRTGLWPALLHR